MTEHLHRAQHSAPRHPADCTHLPPGKYLASSGHIHFATRELKDSSDSSCRSGISTLTILKTFSWISIVSMESTPCDCKELPVSRPLLPITLLMVSKIWLATDFLLGDYTFAQVMLLSSGVVAAATWLVASTGELLKPGFTKFALVMTGACRAIWLHALYLRMTLWKRLATPSFFLPRGDLEAFGGRRLPL